MNDTIICIQCQQNKTINQFHPSALRKKFFCCKSCVSTRDKKRRERNKISERPVLIHKYCKKCGMTLPIKKFGKLLHSKSGFFSWCKECHNKYEKQKRETIAGINKEEIDGKICLSCGLYKSSEEYYILKHTRHGLSLRCKECEKTKWLIYSQKPEVKIRRLQKIKERQAKDPIYKLTETIRSRIRDSIKRQSKSAHTIELLGCTGAECMDHLESLFWPGMTRKNMGRIGWEIDHIMPIGSFDKDDPQWQFKAFHYTNLQSLWRSDNKRKKDRLDWSPLESKYELPDRLKNPIDSVQNGVTLVPSQ